MSLGTQAIACSVLVPVLNEAEFIESMVTSLRAQRYPGELEFLFAYADSRDETTEMLRRLALADERIRLIHNPRASTASGLNIALRAARGVWIARMDGHSVYPPDYIADGIARLEAGDTVWVSGPQRPRGHNTVSRAFSLALDSPLGHGGSRKWSGTVGAKEFELDTGVFGGVWRREILIELGGWDERWIKNEDSELAARVLRRDERLICRASMTADYAPRGSFHDLWRQYRDYGRFRALTARRHPRSLRRSHLLPVGLVATVAFAALTRSRGAVAARVLCWIYAIVLADAAGRAWQHSDCATDAALVPVVVATMHTAHGIGLIEGAIEHGTPWAALASVCGLHRLSELLDETDAVFAPSLDLPDRSS